MLRPYSASLLGSMAPTPRENRDAPRPMHRNAIWLLVGLLIVGVACSFCGTAKRSWSGGRRSRKATKARQQSATKGHLSDKDRPAPPPTLNADLIQKGYVQEQGGIVISPGKARYFPYSDRLRARSASDSPSVRLPAKLLVEAAEQVVGQLPLRDGLSSEHPRTRSSVKRPRQTDDVDHAPPSRVKIALTSDTEIKNLFKVCHEHQLQSTVTGQPCSGELQMVKMQEKGTGGQMIGVAECATCKQKVRCPDVMAHQFLLPTGVLLRLTSHQSFDH